MSGDGETSPPGPLDDDGVRLEELRRRLDELQSGVEGLGAESAPGERSPGPDPGAGPAGGSVTRLDVGLLPNVIELRHFVEAAIGLQSVRDARVRRFGFGRAQIDVDVEDPLAFAREFHRALKPMRVELGAGGEMVVEFGEFAIAGGKRRWRDVHADTAPQPPPERPEAERPRAAPGEPVDPGSLTASTVLPEQVCRHFHMVGLGVGTESLALAMAEPGDRLARDVATALSGRQLEIVPASAEEVEAAIDRAYAAGPEHGIEPAEPGGERAAAQRLAAQLGVPVLEAEGIRPSAEALAAVPESLRGERCLPLAIDESVLYVALAEHPDEETFRGIRERTKLRIQSFVVTRSGLRALLAASAGEGTEAGERAAGAAAEPPGDQPEEPGREERVTAASRRAQRLPVILLALTTLIIVVIVAVFLLS